jgi:hypothetical protein
LQAQLTGQLIAYQTILEDKLTKEELQNLFNKQTKLCQAEEQLAKLQIINNSECQAQIVQQTLPK